VVIPPGDDMGGVIVGGQLVLITVDQLADGVHFDSALTPLELIGRKAITRNLSDVAAMAAKPVGAVCAGCLPRGFGEANANRLFDVMREVAERYGCPLIGGDISVWDQRLILTVTVIAEPAGIEPVLRGGAKPGDVICVTGRLGGSWTAPAESGGGPHMEFEPRVSLARKLAGMVKLHSMMDISDGLAMDLPRICEASKVGAEIEVASLPLRPQAHTAAKLSGKPAWVHGVGDGEDYELLFTVSQADAVKLPGEIDGVPVTRIGRVTGGGGVMLIHEGGRREAMGPGGWEHHE